MNRKPYSVYVRVDEQGRIIEINSSAFLSDVSGWIKVDEGHGVKYHHAQFNYLSAPMMDERGIYRFKMVNGAIVERSETEMDADYIPPEPSEPPVDEPEKPVEDNSELKERVDNLEKALTALMEGVSNV